MRREGFLVLVLLASLLTACRDAPRAISAGETAAGGPAALLVHNGAVSPTISS